MAIVHNIPSPYRLPLFASLARAPGIELRVIFQARRAAERGTWQPPGDLPFEADWVAQGTYGRLRSASGVVRALRRFRPEVIVLGGYDSVASLAALTYGRLRRIPVVLWSGSTEGERATRRRLKEPLKRRIVAACQAYVAYGTRARAYLERYGAKSDRIAIAPNTVDVAFFRQAAAGLDQGSERERLGLDRDARIALFAGQLIDRKDPIALLAALHRLRLEGIEATALFVGDGPMREGLVRTAELAGVPIAMHRGVAPEAMPGYYVASDLLVLPSKEEVWGLVANEAMACRRPVVISDACGAAADLVEDGVSGFVVEQGDAGGLARAVRALITDEELRRRMGRTADARMDAFTIEGEASGILRAVEIAAAGRG